MGSCPQCGAELDSGTPAGLCPECLIRGAFDSSVGSNRFGAPAVETAAATDQDFGPYRIVRTLGEGGMGAVYLAEQREPIRRSVALKVVKPGMDTGQVLARFANERQALAMMDHPNIARILDAGATPRGRPYFVMEYIDGVPITEYCDDKRLTIPQRLELFVAVCHAVEHANRKGVIHRDLKPSNVLVTEQEGAPVAKVIDFGIAKATDQWAIRKTLLTEFGQMVGTPEYASPEQAEVITGDVDKTTDVYSLGVLLYELLIGAVPFDPARLRRAGLVEMLRIIREEEAPPLSRRLTATGAAAHKAAEYRRTDFASLRKIVDGDLTWITLKALDKVRERRYASAGELARDVQRHIEHRPVLASPPSRFYRARKFVRRRRTLVFGAAAGLAVIALGAVTAWLLVYRDVPLRPKLTDKDTIVLADFDNQTGDPVFDDTLRQGLAVQLRQSPYLSMISDQKIRQTLQLMGKPPDQRLTADVAREVCERTGGAAMLIGSIAGLGSRYVIGLRAITCSTGDTLDEQQVQSRKKEGVLDAVSEMAGRFRARAGESLAGIQRNNVPLREATTSSLAALQAYSSAVKGVGGGYEPYSVALLKQATEIDPQFALAWADLALAYSDLGEQGLARECTVNAYKWRDHASGPEKFQIAYAYDRNVTGNLEKAWETASLWRQAYPRDASAFDLSAGYAANGTGRFDEVIKFAETAHALDPAKPSPVISIVSGNMYLDRFETASRAIQRYSSPATDPTLILFRYYLAFLRGDQAEMSRTVSESKPSDAEEMLNHSQALVAAQAGRLMDADRFTRRAVDLAQRAGSKERAATWIASQAVWSGFYENKVLARQRAETALTTASSRDLKYAAALALALAGEFPSSDTLAVELEKAYPEDTAVQSGYLPVLRGLAAIGRKNPHEAIGFLQANSPYEFGVPPLGFNTYFGGLYPVYVRGLAYLAMNDGAQAAAEFQKILDHKGLTVGDPVVAMARLQLARAWRLGGDKERAKAAYLDFLALWKYADTDIPILRAAKAEYARLR